MGRAAVAHGVSQAAVSARIRSLESALGLTLLERSPRGTRLTPDGALVVERARAALDAAHALDEGVAALRTDRAARLRVAASVTVAEYLLPRWLVALRAELPGTAVTPDLAQHGRGGGRRPLGGRRSRLRRGARAARRPRRPGRRAGPAGARGRPGPSVGGAPGGGRVPVGVDPAGGPGTGIGHPRLPGARAGCPGPAGAGAGIDDGDQERRRRRGGSRGDQRSRRRGRGRGGDAADGAGARGGPAATAAGGLAPWPGAVGPGAGAGADRVTTLTPGHARRPILDDTPGGIRPTGTDTRRRSSWPVCGRPSAAAARRPSAPAAACSRGCSAGPERDLRPWAADTPGGIHGASGPRSETRHDPHAVLPGMPVPASYLVGDETTGRAVVVDPRRDVGEYLADAAAHGLTIVGVIDTHFHADFLAGHLELAERTGAWIGFGDEARPEFPARLLADGERIELGDVVLEVLATPGHTPESISVLVWEHAGDAVPPLRPHRRHPVRRRRRPAGPAGLDRRDRRRARPAAARLGGPPHGAARRGAGAARPRRGVGLREEPVHRARVDHRRPAARQPRLPADRRRGLPRDGHRRSAGRARLLRPRRDRQPARARAVRPGAAHAPARRRRGRRPDRPGRGPARHPRRGRLRRRAPPGSLSVPLDGRFAETAGTVVDPDRDVVVVAPQDREEEVVTRLARIGADRVLGYLRDPDAVLAEPGRTQRSERLDAAALAEMLAGPDRPEVLDVRNRGELAAGAVPGARQIPLAELPRRLDEVARDRTVVVHCAGGYRSGVAASLLRRAGFADVRDLAGGYAAWAALPEERRRRADVAAHLHHELEVAADWQPGPVRPAPVSDGTWARNPGRQVPGQVVTGVRAQAARQGVEHRDRGVGGPGDVVQLQVLLHPRQEHLLGERLGQHGHDRHRDRGLRRRAVVGHRGVVRLRLGRVAAPALTRSHLLALHQERVGGQRRAVADVGGVVHERPHADGHAVADPDPAGLEPAVLQRVALQDRPGVEHDVVAEGDQALLRQGGAVVEDAPPGAQTGQAVAPHEQRSPGQHGPDVQLPEPLVEPEVAVVDGRGARLQTAEAERRALQQRRPHHEQQRAEEHGRAEGPQAPRRPERHRDPERDQRDRDAEGPQQHRDDEGRGVVAVLGAQPAGQLLVGGRVVRVRPRAGARDLHRRRAEQTHPGPHRPVDRDHDLGREQHVVADPGVRRQVHVVADEVVPAQPHRADPERVVRQLGVHHPQPVGHHRPGADAGVPRRLLAELCAEVRPRLPQVVEVVTEALQVAGDERAVAEQQHQEPRVRHAGHDLLRDVAHAVEREGAVDRHEQRGQPRQRQHGEHAHQQGGHDQCHDRDRADQEEPPVRAHVGTGQPDQTGHLRGEPGERGHDEGEHRRRDGPGQPGEHRRVDDPAQPPRADGIGPAVVRVGRTGGRAVPDLAGRDGDTGAQRRGVAQLRPVLHPGPDVEHSGLADHAVVADADRAELQRTGHGPVALQRRLRVHDRAGADPDEVGGDRDGPEQGAAAPDPRAEQPQPGGVQRVPTASAIGLVRISVETTQNRSGRLPTGARSVRGTGRSASTSRAPGAARRRRAPPRSTARPGRSATPPRGGGDPAVAEDQHRGGGEAGREQEQQLRDAGQRVRHRAGAHRLDRFGGHGRHDVAERGGEPAHGGVAVDVACGHRRQVVATAHGGGEPGQQQRGGAELVEEVGLDRDLGGLDPQRGGELGDQAALDVGRRAHDRAGRGHTAAGRRGQVLAVRLVAGGHRDELEVLEVGGHHVGRQPVLQAGPQVGRRLRAADQAVVADELLRAGRRLEGVHHRHRDRRVVLQHGLDLGELDAVAADLDLQVDAAPVLDLAVGVDPRQVTGAVDQPGRVVRRSTGAGTNTSAVFSSRLR
ncbi:hypothetical protein L7F22_007032 [Adiantum nelumboides]|nr:hypothetical protein [Adiantum nelumboides]